MRSMIWSGSPRSRFWKYPEGDEGGAGGGGGGAGGAAGGAAGGGGGAGAAAGSEGAEPKPGEVIGATADGGNIRKSGAKADAPDFRSAGRAFLAAEKAKGTPGTSLADVGTGADEGEGGDEGDVADEGLVELPDDASDEERTAFEAARVAREELEAFETQAEKTARLAEEKTAAQAAAKAKADAAAAGEEGDPKVETIVLRGLADRSEEDIPLEIDDPEIATRIRRLQNDGMRRSSYDEAMRDVDGRAAELFAIEEALSQDPVAYLLQHTTVERQQEIAQALLLEHLDTLAPIVDELTADQAERHKRRADLKDRLRGVGDIVKTVTARQNAAAAVMRAVQALVPDGTERADAEMFLADAERDLVLEVKAGRRVTPESVAKTLERRVKMYGYTPGAAGDAAARGGAPAARAPKAGDGSARPVGDRAKELATKRDNARKAQDRIRRSLAGRRVASKVAPTGAGAGAVTMPTVSATADVRQASQQIRRALKPGQGWPKA